MLDSAFPNFMGLTVCVALPIVAAFIVWALGEKRQQASRIVAIGSGFIPPLILAFAAFRLMPETGLQLGDRFPFWPDLGMSFALAIDGLSLPFALLAACLGALGVAAARRGPERAFALLAQSAAMLVFLAQDLFLFLAAFGSLPLLLYVLVTFWGRGASEYAATKFLMMTLTGTALLSVSLVATYLVGNNDASMALLFFNKPGFPVAYLNHWVLAGILLAVWVSAPLFPFHTWLADVYESAPPSALPLVVGGVQAGGLYALVRLAMGLYPSYLGPWLPWMTAIGALSALYAVMAAWGQRSLLRSLALLSVAVAGMGLAALSALSGPDSGTLIQHALLLALAATAAFGLLGWLTAELLRRTGPQTNLIPLLGLLAPRGATAFMGVSTGALGLVTLSAALLVLPLLAGNRPGLAIVLGLAILTILLTGALTLRRVLLAPATPAQVDGIEDLPASELALAWALMLLAAVPGIWLLFGNRAIAIFASQLGLGFGR